MAIASLRSPELYAGCPQQGCNRGTSTSQPASAISLMAAKPIVGRNKSTRQVTNNPTLGRRTSCWDIGNLAASHPASIAPPARKQQLVSPQRLKAASLTL